MDDDPDDLDMFKEALLRVDEHAVCIEKKDGKEALDYLSNESTVLPEIIFLDLNMPRINGKQCVAEIKRSKRLSDIPIVIYSTTKRMEDEEYFKSLGVELFMIKPSSFPEICESIRGAFKVVFSS